MRITDIEKTENLTTEQDLFEVNMSPGNLDKLVQSLDIKAGIEYEMIIPDVGRINDNDYPEPDYSEDRRAHSISDVVSFFDDGDHNYGRTIRDFEESLRNDFQEWFSEHLSEKWHENAEEYVREYIIEEEGKSLRREAEDEVFEQHPGWGKNAEEMAKAVEELFQEKVDAMVETAINDTYSDTYYERAREQWEQEKYDDQNSDDESNFFDDKGLTHMSDFETYDIQWPYYNYGDSDSEYAVESVADELEAVLGTTVNWATDYHGATRDDDAYALEPDGSLSGDDSDDAGLELISPPMPLKELFDDMDKIRAWADKRGVKTGKEYGTGLHMNISVGDMKDTDVDYIKLAILIGDKYVLEQFDRAANTYCRSAIDKIKDRAGSMADRVGQLFDAMRSGMDQLATAAIHAPSTEKFTSINMKKSYVEFRSPGGAWLDEDPNKLKNTVKRFAVALDASMDPQKYRKEYLKKLYALLKTNGDSTSPLGLYAQYVAGIVDRDTVAQKWRKLKFERHARTSGELYNWKVSFGQNYATVVAGGELEAKQLARQRWSAPELTDDQLVAEPVGKHDPERDGKPVNAKIGDAHRIGSHSVDENDYDTWPWWTIFRRTDAQIVHRFRAPSRTRAEERAKQHLDDLGIVDPDRFSVDLDANPPMDGSTIDHAEHRRFEQERQAQRQTQQTSLEPAQTQSSGGEFTGHWLIKAERTGEVLYRFGGIGNSQADANRVAAQWLRGSRIDDPVEVVPEMA